MKKLLTILTILIISGCSKEEPIKIPCTKGIVNLYGEGAKGMKYVYKIDSIEYSITLLPGQKQQVELTEGIHVFTVTNLETNEPRKERATVFPCQETKI